MKKLAAVFLSLILALSGCASVGTEDLMTGIRTNLVTDAEAPDSVMTQTRGETSPELKEPDTASAMDFSIRLFRTALEPGENTLISPLSVLSALAMTAGGAAGETLNQMEQALGMGSEKLDAFFGSYMATPERQEGALHLANSIWFTDDNRFTVNQDFLQRNAECYGADIYRTAMDNTAVKAINDWVKEKTDGMIPEILDKAPADAIMYLVNALAFEAKWETPYYTHQVREAEFTREDGTEKKADMMYSEEYAYLETENAAGFIKYYEGRDYAFVALLPNEGISVADYVASLTGEKLTALLSAPQNIMVQAGIPKFESEYSVLLNDVLKEMGMVDAFDPVTADFSCMGSSEDGGIHISRVLHKTFISVAEEGTRAGAATLVEAADGASMIGDFKTVILNRPFVYLLIDTRTHLPFFMGTVMGK